MMEPRAGSQAWIRQADSALETARQRLLAPTPDAVEAAGEAFAEAIGALQALRVACPGLEPSDRAGLAETLHALGLKARWLASLLEHAAQLRLGWARVLAATVAGYTEHGEPAPLAPPPTVSIQG